VSFNEAFGEVNAISLSIKHSEHNEVPVVSNKCSIMRVNGYLI